MTTTIDGELVGGTVDDALSYECARVAQVDVLLSFHLRASGLSYGNPGGAPM